MSFHRAILITFTAMFSGAFASGASAQCGNCAAPATVTYMQVAPVQTYAPVQPCGGCGAPVVYAQPAPQPVVMQGCGGCGTPVVYAQPAPVVQPVPVMAAPIAVDHWDTGGCGCGSCGGCQAPVTTCGGCGSSTFGYHAAVVASPLYVVNQGPEYSGPGLMVPYGTYSPATNVASPAAYPYVSGPGYRYGPRFAHPYYRANYAYRHNNWQPHYYPHRWRG
jgi:hypothetical protein